MGKRPSWLLRALGLLRRDNLHRILGVLVLLSVISAVGLWRLEPETRLIDWLWWSIVTLTTVGYGDFAPTTVPGRLIGIVLMFFGIGALSMLTATIASFFVERNLKRERGMVDNEFKDHIVLCQWNSRAGEILRELRADARTAEAPIVLLAELPAKPVEDERLHFIHGALNEENLRRASVERASTVVILSDDRLDESTRDAQTVLATLAVESLNPDTYTIVELVREENVRHCQRAKADEIIVGHQLSSRLIASSAIDHGLSKVVAELLSQRYGNDLKRLPLPAELAGLDFLAALAELKRTNKAIAVAVQRGEEVVTNPPGDYRLAAGDHLIVISEHQNV